jgi:hypothetical protein
MDLSTLAWLGLLAYAMHILEEYMLDWKDWARSQIGLPVEWNDFYVTNGIVIVFGIVQAALVPTLPIVAMSFAGLMLINATFFHVLPFIRGGGRFSPGLFTAVALFFPIGLETYRVALSTGAVSARAALAGLVAGALLMAYPIVLLRLRSLPYFIQDGRRS